MNQPLIDESAWLKNDLNFLLGFSVLPYFLSEEVQKKYDKIKMLRDKILTIYSKNQRHEIRDILFISPKLIELILETAKEGNVSDFTKSVQDAYIQILRNQYSFSSRCLPEWNQWKDSWIEKREFHTDEYQRINLERFPEPHQKPNIVQWLDTITLRKA